MAKTAKSYFGTDGIRGEYGGPVLNDTFARRLGFALAQFLIEKNDSLPQHILIARDTRASGPALAAAISEGLCASGMRIYDAGVAPTPAAALAVREAGANLGIVITASHNPASDNGIKFFSPLGRKLDDADEFRIEELVDGLPPEFPEARVRSTAYDATTAYRDMMARQLPENALVGWKVVVDAAHGASFAATPETLHRLGAEVVPIGVEPDGSNINAGVGSEHPEALAARVRESGARLGVANDGDGDRVVICDETGSVLDGDETLAILGLHALRKGELAGNTVVATVMSNLGLDQAVEAAGGKVVRVAVGDRHVIRELYASGFSFGGESSGHIVFAGLSTTGDGLLAALKIIEVMRDTGQPLSELRRCLAAFPQEKANLPVRQKIPLDDLPEYRDGILRLEESLPGRGRILVRYSGTEPKIRLLVEGEDAGIVTKTMQALHELTGRFLELT